MINLNLIESCETCLCIENQKDFSLEEIIISTDTRKLDESNAFVCLYGENFDAHEFIPDLLNSHFPLIVAEKNKFLSDFSEISSCIVLVSNTFDFIKELAAKVMSNWKALGGVCIGITGSNGKTTNKEILKHLASKVIGEKLHATLGNLNNQIGVPLTIFKLKKEHSFAIVEMGTSEPGEIKILSDIAQPDYGFITNIGPAHLDFLKNLEGVYNEKIALYFYIKNNINIKNNFVVNLDDEYLNQLSEEEGVITFGTQKGQWKIQFKKKSMLLNNGLREIKLENDHIFSRHHWYNLCQCFLLMQAIFPSESQTLIDGIKSFELPNQNRGTWVRYKEKKIFMDAYNANPASVKASLSGFLLELEKEKIPKANILIILGDMKELGSESKRYHEEVGQFVYELLIENAVFIGSSAEHYQRGFKRDSDTFRDAAAAKKHIDSLLDSYTHIFIKGSRSLQLESMLDITF